MKQRRLAAVIGMFWVVQGCSEAHDGSNVGEGGSAGSAGSASTSGGSSATAGSGGAGTSGNGSGLPACSAPTTAVAFPWSFLPNSQGIGGAGPDPEETAGAGGARAQSGCVPAGEELPGNNVDCAGLASVELDAAGNAKLTFDDGNALVSSALDASAALLAHGAVWVSYLDSFAFDCPYCGGRTQRRFEVRAGADGELLVFGVDGEIAQTVPKVVNDEVFGAPLEVAPQCEYDFDLDCSHVKRMPLDTVVKSSPEQTLSHGVPSVTTSAAGARFRVTIARSQDARSAIQGCYDGRTPAADSTFYAERLSDLE